MAGVGKGFKNRSSKNTFQVRNVYKYVSPFILGCMW